MAKKKIVLDPDTVTCLLEVVTLLVLLVIAVVICMTMFPEGCRPLEAHQKLV